MSDSVAHEQIRAFVERIERLEEERASIAKDIGEVYAEAKGNGFDRKALKIVVTRRRQDHNERMELEALVELYEAALIGRSADDYEEFGTVVATRAPARATREDEPEHDADGVIIEPEAAMLPQTAGSETAVAAGAPEGEHSPHASEPIRRMSMTPLEPREAGGLKGFGFTVRFDEPETIPPVADPATVVSEAANGDSAPSLAAIPVADRSQPNPICRDPDDCGVYASWAMPCQACKAAAAHRSAA